MKSAKRLLSVSLAALLVLGTAATAQAKNYNVADDEISVSADANGQTVTVGMTGGPQADPSPVLSGTTDKNNIFVLAFGGNADLTLRNLTVNSSQGMTLDLIPVDGVIDLILQGKNLVNGSPDFGTDGLCISGAGADQSAVVIRGTGSLTANDGGNANDNAVFVMGANLSVESGSLVAESPNGYGIGLYGGSTLSVSGDYLHPASVTARGGEGSIDIDAISRLILEENVFILDENGRDITALVLADPSILKTIKFVIISTKDIAVFPSDKMESNVHMMTAYKNTKFEQTGEPSAEAMKSLSEGMNGEALYAGSFAFTDDIGSHGMFQLNIMLPQYAGRHVKLVTLENGKAVSYDRWVCNDGMVWAHVDHLGDFAVFAA